MLNSNTRILVNGKWQRVPLNNIGVNNLGALVFSKIQGTKTTVKNNIQSLRKVVLTSN